MNDVRRWKRGFEFGPWCLLALMTALAGTSSCLNRPVQPTEPETSNRFVDQVRLNRVDKIDFLFVIDNSVSMADKQELLKRAVPTLLRRTLEPPCIDDSGADVVAPPGADCPAGSSRAFPAIDDVHIAVVSSSLGTSGGGSCAADSVWNNDRGHLLPSVREAVPSWNGSGYLVWDPHAKQSPPGHSDLDALIDDFSTTVDQVGESGCGFESTLEAWYRFLVDPEPPLEIVREGKVSVARGVDEELLRQRAGFLRPDSLVGIVMLTDEDDCSIADSGAAWLMSAANPRPRPTSACATDPSSPCCRPCTVDESGPPPGCLAIADDQACATPEYPATDAGDDHRNLRCVDQKRRFGMEFLHPTSRYIAGLTEPMISNRSGVQVKNPLFHSADGTRTRDRNQVFLAGIVGVPWQDVATSESLQGPGLEYLDSEGLAAESRWELMTGGDPLMRVSSAPRSGTHPLLGVPLAPASSLNPLENPVNGHEYVNTDNSDLQYACTFPLENPRTCDGTIACDCDERDLPRNRPLCQLPEGSPAGTKQYFAKAYPGLRHLEVLHGVGESGLVASICPKVALGSDAGDPSYGYNPALEYLAGRLSGALQRCLPRPLDVEADGTLPCRIAESVAGSCDCSAPGRSQPSPELESAVRVELEREGHCGGDTDTSCSDMCVCEIQQTTGDAQTACQNDEQPLESATGYCYVDSEQGVGNAKLVEKCPPTERRTLRFVGADTPRNRAVLFMACSGAPVRQAE